MRQLRDVRKREIKINSEIKLYEGSYKERKEINKERVEAF
jgi:hypothetical protein